MDATAGSVAWTLVGGLVTLAVFSFLYKDNPLYKLAEHIAVGVSVGFLVVNYYYTVFMPKVWDNVVHRGQFDYLIPLIFGLLLYTRFVPKWGWISRWSLAFLLGAGSGMSIPANLESRVLKQIEGSMASLWVPVSGDIWSTILQTLVSVFLVVGTIACLVFFLFSVEHKGRVGKLAYFGRLCIMAGFGASFGYTVMARVSLLIGRIEFLTQDCWKAIGQLFS